MLLRLEAIQKSFGERVLFDSLDWVINAGDKIALIGPNGSGKTTLLALLTGQLTPDRGQVFCKRNLAVAHVEQAEFDATETGNRTVLSQALSVFDSLIQMEHRILDLQRAMAENPERAAGVSDEYSHLIDRFRLEGGYRFRSLTESVLQGLGFSREALFWPLQHLSGGQQSRLKLAQALLSEPELLALDEPTNHLDIDAVEWLEDYLREIRCAVIVVSHDRFFLDRVAEKTVELRNRGLREFSGNYSFYRRERDLIDSQQATAFSRQQEHIERTEEFIRRNLAGQKTKQAKSRRKMLERMERIEAVEVTESIRLEVREAPGHSQQVLRCENLAVGYQETPLIEGIDLIVCRGSRFGVIGGNGAGKTTLLRTLMGEIPPVVGVLQRSSNLVWSYFSQTQEDLNPANSILAEIHDASPDSSQGALRNHLAGFLFRGDDVFKPIGVLSGGEKSRVALAKLLLRPAHVMLLDEPTNHLDIPAREALEAALQEFTGTLFVVSHDRYFLGQLGTEVLHLQERRLEKFADLKSFESRRSGTPVATPPLKPSTAAAMPDVKVSSSRPKAALSKNEQTRLQKQLLSLEQRIHRLEAERDGISAEMQQLEGREFQRMNELATRYESLDLELTSVYSEWEALMMHADRA